MPAGRTRNRSSKSSPGLTEQPSTAASQARTKASDFGHHAAEKIDDGRENAAAGIESVASAIHDNAGRSPGEGNASAAAVSAADSLHFTADYIRNCDIESMMGDLQRLVKNNPGPALLGATFLGLLLGRAFANE